MMLITDVDDIMVAGSETDCCNVIYRSPCLKLPMTDLGACTWYDGYAIVQDRERGVTTISQHMRLSRAWWKVADEGGHRGNAMVFGPHVTRHRQRRADGSSPSARAGREALETGEEDPRVP